MSNVAQTVVAAANLLGEGVQWCPRTQALYWTDILASTLWRYTPHDGATRQWPMPERLASFALCESDGWLLLGLASQLAFFHLDSGALQPIVEVEADLPTRVNDAVCDRQGRFVFGTLHEPAEGMPQQPVGGFYRLNTDLSLERLPLPPVAISNSLAFSPDGRTMYFCDSPTRHIQCCDYATDGTIGAPRRFVDLADMSGEPDGSTVDADGGLWNAHWGMSRVRRYRADGHGDTTIELPARQPTRAALGGAALDTLYITSARQGLSEQCLRDEPLNGALFSAPAPKGVRGLAEARFGGKPFPLEGAAD